MNKITHIKDKIFSITNPLTTLIETPQIEESINKYYAKLEKKKRIDKFEEFNRFYSHLLHKNIQGHKNYTNPKKYFSYAIEHQSEMNKYSFSKQFKHIKSTFKRYEKTGKIS